MDRIDPTSIKTLTQTYLSYLFSLDKESRETAKTSLPHQIIWSSSFTGYSSLAGFASGAYLGARTRSHQFLAENAHRLPKLVTGWYYYHKYKNNEMTLAGIKGGIRYATRFAAISGCFSLLEVGSEKYLSNGREGLVNGVVAGLGSAGLFGLIS